MDGHICLPIAFCISHQLNREMIKLLAMSSFIFILFLTFFSFAVAYEFLFINQGEFGEYPTEYGADYRFLYLYAHPFSLCFYNTTPNAHIFAIVMGLQDANSIRLRLRWVWDANRNHPVREHSAYKYGPHGIVITDVDGKVSWKTKIGKQHPVDSGELMHNGNYRLTDKRGRVLWQSFDYPSDSLLVGQSLSLKGPTQIVSRTSDKNPSPGPYSLVLERNRLVLYFKSKSNQILWYTPEVAPKGLIQRVVFNSSPVTFKLTLDFYLANSTSAFDSITLASPKYNTTFSFLRLGTDGNLKIYTYKGPYGDNDELGEWEVTPSLFHGQ